MKERKSIGVIMLEEEEQLFINEEAEKRGMSRSELVQELIQEKNFLNQTEPKYILIEDHVKITLGIVRGLTEWVKHKTHKEGGE